MAAAPVTLGEALEAARVRRGLSPVALAAAVGRELRAMGCDKLAEVLDDSHHGAAANYVPERHVMPARVLVAWCRVLCVDVGEVVEEVTEWKS